MGASELFSLSQIPGVRKDANFEKEYLLGQFGGVPDVREFGGLSSMAKSKPWTKAARGRAPEGTRTGRRVLIYCEDNKSFADYLKCFPVDERVEVKVVGTGMNTDSLVKAAIKAKGDARNRGESYSEVWCVFDRDNFPLKNYVLAFTLASLNTINLAWTNEAFELWYLLHFDYIDYIDSALSRTDYAKKLSQRGLKYKKTDQALGQEQDQASSTPKACGVAPFIHSDRRRRFRPGRGRYAIWIAGNIRPVVR